MTQAEQNQAPISYTRNLLVGAAMGVANIIPGVSGGTIAVVFGIYEELMEALANFLTNREKRARYIRFLATLFAGAGIAIVAFARVLSWAYEHYPMMTVYFFMGLILGSIPVVVRAHDDMKPTLFRGLAFLAGMAAVVGLAMMQGAESGTTQAPSFDSSGFTPLRYAYLLLAGMIAASAMIIPGISGSFILILLGVYWVVLGSLSGLTSVLFADGLTSEMLVRFLILGSLGVGVVIGILVFSRVMSFLLKHQPAATMYAILGLILGSFYQIYPGFTVDASGLGAIVTFALGTFISLRFSKK